MLPGKATRVGTGTSPSSQGAVSNLQDAWEECSIIRPTPRRAVDSLGIG